jgi:signal transduction histidine kinase
MPDHSDKISFSAWTEELKNLILESKSLFVALFAADRTLIFANAAMRSLFKGDPARSLLNPAFDDLWSAQSASSTVYRGFLTVGDYSSVNTSIPVRVYRKQDRLLIIGDLDAGQLAEQNEAMFDFNREINNLQRQLIKEKHSLELALNQLNEANTKLKELNATKDRFFSIIAHDLRNPFNAIIGLASLLIEQVREKDYEAIDQYAGIIESSAQRAMALLVNLLDWARVQTGKMEFAPTALDLAREIDDAVNLAQDAARQKAIAIERKLPAHAAAFADRAMLGVVLRNLISNAIKFTRHNGRIVIAAEPAPDGWQLSVADNGVGMSEEALDKLFRIDQNHSTAGTDNESGTGLGLILCQEFIARHGGNIRAESEAGCGSKFIFTLPDPKKS